MGRKSEISESQGTRVVVSFGVPGMRFGDPLSAHTSLLGCLLFAKEEFFRGAHNVLFFCALLPLFSDDDPRCAATCVTLRWLRVPCAIPSRRSLRTQHLTVAPAGFRSSTGRMARLVSSLFLFCFNVLPWAELERLPRMVFFFVLSPAQPLLGAWGVVCVFR